MRNRNNNIAIIGGGILGMTAALALLDAGHGVTIFDPDEGLQAASWGNAGHIAVEQVEPIASPATIAGVPGRLLDRDSALSLPLRAAGAWLPFGLSMMRAARPASFAAGRAALTGLIAGAMQAWVDLVERLGEPDLLIREGHYIVWDTAESAREGMDRWQAMQAPTAGFRPVVPHEIEELTRLIGHRPAGALRTMDSGHIASHARLHAALKAAIIKAGGVWKAEAASPEMDRAGRCRIAGYDGFDHAVMAAGIGSRPLMERLGHHVPMIAERGYHLQAEGANWPQNLPPVVFEDRSMIVTRFENGVRASSFVEFATPDFPADPRKWAILRRHLSELNLPFDLPGKEWMGARPTLPDYLPAIGRSRRIGNLFYAFGHNHLGLTLGPVTAALMSQMIAGQTTDIDLSPFDIARFSKKDHS